MKAFELQIGFSVTVFFHRMQGEQLSQDTHGKYYLQIVWLPVQNFHIQLLI